MTDERVRALIREVADVVARYRPNWTARPDEDPGIVLLDLVGWLADTLIEYQTHVAGEAALGTRRRLGLLLHHGLSGTSPVITVDGVRWEPVAAGTSGAGGNRVYVVEPGADGATTLVFGDGRRGAPPPADGTEVAATYRFGAGARGLTVTCPWPPEPQALTVRLDRRNIVFEPPRPRRWGLLGRLIDCFR